MGKIKVALASVFLVFIAVFGVQVGLSQSTFASTVSEAKDGVKEVGGGTSGTSTIKSLITTVINVLLFLIGSFAVIMIIIAGLRLVTANGDSNTVSSAKNTIIYAVIGIIVAVSAYAIVNFILGQIT